MGAKKKPDAIDRVVGRMQRGELKLYEADRALKGDSAAATEARRRLLERRFKTRLKHISSSTVDFNDATGRNVENPVGATQVPLGYAGDLRVNGNDAVGAYPILLATTEGKLVAGISRGISVCNGAGGVNVAVLKDGMTRDILVRTGGAKDSARLVAWIRSDDGQRFLQRAFAEKTRHGSLIEVRPYTSGRYVHMRFRATTGAAMGMNMVTIAASNAARMMAKNLKRDGLDLAVISETGNMCADKKPAYINMLEGRGVSLIADITIPRSVIEKRLRTTPEAMEELNRAKNLVGSALAGSHGYNAHVANILAAMYIAHGQDVAQIVEGAQAMTDVSVRDEDLYISCYLPSIEVGTYGGGTARETQSEALALLGLNGKEDATGKTRRTLAEIIAAACLAGELNLLSIEAAGELSESHSTVKRG